MNRTLARSRGVAVLLLLFSAEAAQAQDCGPSVQIYPSGRPAGGTFGNTLSISGDYFVVDAPRGGAGYVFQRLGTAWSEMQRLSRPRGSVGEASIDGDLVLFGMRDANPQVYRLEDGNWVNDGILQSDMRGSASYGQFSDIGGRVAAVAEHDAERVHLFYRGDDGVWVQEDMLTAVGGWNVATDGARVIVGDPGDGIARVFRRESGGEWVLEDELNASDGCSVFGAGLAIQGELALVGGAPDWSGNPCGGKGYIFRRQGEEWEEEQILQPDGLPANERFGRERAVSIDGNRAVLGAFADSMFEEGTGSGAAYVYRHDGELWVLETTFAPPQPRNSWLASSVAVGGDTVLVGAPEDSSAGARVGTAHIVDLNERPEAAFAIEPASLIAGVDALFDASASTAPAGEEIFEYAWDFGDGETAAGVMAEHVYARAGRYPIVLRIETEESCALASELLPVACPSEDVAPWSAADVGEPALPGGARLFEGDTGGLDLCAGGDRIATREDEFHFVYQQVSGDVLLRARLDEFDAALRAVTGIMVRTGLGADMRHASILVENPSSPLTPTSTLDFRARQEDGGSTSTESGDAVAAYPVWLELRRDGDELVGLASNDGESWTEVGRSEISLPESVLLGVVLSTRDVNAERAHEAGLARFSDLSLEVMTPPPGTPFRRADPNEDDATDLSDGLFIFNFLFLGGPRPSCMKSADADDSNDVELTDGIFIFNHLFLGGSAPPPPFESCGEDPTDDELTCELHQPCES